MTELLKKVQPGDKLRFPASTFNTFVDVANAWKGERFAGGRGLGATDTGQQFVIVQNTTGSDLDRFSVLGIDVPIILPSDNLDRFKNHIVFKGRTPAVSDEGRFVILLEPLANGAIGRACVAGVCPVKVNVTDEGHVFAEVEAGFVGRLASTATGSAVVLWKESGTGEKWAVIRLGCRAAGALVEIFTDDFNQKDGPLEKRWRHSLGSTAATVLDNSVRCTGWTEYIVKKCGYDADLALDGSYTHRMSFNNYYVPGGKTGIDDFYIYVRVEATYARAVQLRLNLNNDTSVATLYLEKCNNGPFETIQSAIVPWPTGWFNLRQEVRGNSFEGYLNDTLYVQGVTDYGAGGVYTGKFLGWGVVQAVSGQHEIADDYALFIYS